MNFIIIAIAILVIILLFVYFRLLTNDENQDTPPEKNKTIKSDKEKITVDIPNKIIKVTPEISPVKLVPVETKSDKRILDSATENIIVDENSDNFNETCKRDYSADEIFRALTS